MSGNNRAGARLAPNEAHMTAVDHFEATKTLLKEKLLTKGWELQDEHTRELYFLSANKRHKLKFSEEEIDSYSQSYQQSQRYETIKGSIGICAANYREELLSDIGGDIFANYLMSKKITRFLPNTKGEPYCEVGPATPLFRWWSFTFDDRYLDYCMDRIYRRRAAYSTGFELLRQLPTIKVYDVGGRDAKESIEKSAPLIDSCLFQLAYMFNIGLEIAFEWPERKPIERPVRFDEWSSNMENQKMPITNFSGDIVKHYIRGISSNDPVNQFLSFYHVLEYFFVEINDELLYEKLRMLVRDPKFKAHKRELDRVIQETLNHRRERDETEMLKAVINKFSNEEDVKETMKIEETKLSEKIYSSKQTLYGETFPKINFTTNVIPEIARRIKHIRNALVHSSDRYERNDRYVPSRLAEARLRQEIPLLKFLAERVVVGSAAG
jgi:hypothetical protein